MGATAEKTEETEKKIHRKEREERKGRKIKGTIYFGFEKIIIEGGRVEHYRLTRPALTIGRLPKKLGNGIFFKNPERAKMDGLFVFLCVQ